MIIASNEKSRQIRNGIRRPLSAHLLPLSYALAVIVINFASSVYATGENAGSRAHRKQDNVSRSGALIRTALFLS